MEIKVLALQSPQIIINELASNFEHQIGYRITQLLHHAEMPIHVKQRTDAEGIFDAAFLVPALLDQLAKEGKIISDTRTNFLRVPIGIAVRAGAAKPDISSVESFKRTLLDVKSIAYLKAGTGGPYLKGLFERLGIASEMHSRLPGCLTRHPLIGPGAQRSPGSGVILTLWTIPSCRDGSK